MSYKTALRALPLVIALGLTACGGGGGSDSSTGTGGNSGGGSTGGSTTGNLSTVVAPASYAASSPEASIYAGINAARLAGGFGTLKQDTNLDAAAKAHANYTLQNYMTAGGYIDAVKIQQVDPASGQLVSHTETAGNPGFTGVQPADRAAAAGYSGSVAENMNYPFVVLGNVSAAAQLCFDGLIASPGHRQALLDPANSEIGVGWVVNATSVVSTATTDYSNVFQASCPIIVGYKTSARGVAPTGWVGTWPLADTTVSSTGDGHGYGYPASVTVDSSQTLAVTSFVITRTDTGATVPTTSTIAQTGVAPNWAFAVPTVPLAAATEYQVAFVGQSSSGTSITKTWKFKTP